MKTDLLPRVNQTTIKHAPSKMITLLGTVLAKGRILSFLQDSNVSLARAAHLFPGIAFQTLLV